MFSCSSVRHATTFVVLMAFLAVGIPHAWADDEEDSETASTSTNPAGKAKAKEPRLNSK